MAVDVWDGLWPMKWSGRAEVDHTWRDTPSGHQCCLEKGKIEISCFYSPTYKDSEMDI